MTKLGELGIDYLIQNNCFHSVEAIIHLTNPCHWVTNFESPINALLLLHLRNKEIHTGVDNIINSVQMLRKLLLEQESSIISFMMFLKRYRFRSKTVFSIMRFSGIIFESRIVHSVRG